MSIGSHHRYNNDFFFSALEAIDCGNFNSFVSCLSNLHFFELFTDFTHLRTIWRYHTNLAFWHIYRYELFDHLYHKVYFTKVVL